MQVRWRGLELPARVDKDAKSSADNFGRFTAEPFVRGMGTTIGNSLRRILLSTIEGAAVTKVEIKGVQHEFDTMEGVLQDVTDIILNMKGLVVSMTGEGPKTMKLCAEGPGDVTAEMIECDTSITVHNPEHVIATLGPGVEFEATFTVETGRGYRPAGRVGGRWFRSCRSPSGRECRCRRDRRRHVRDRRQRTHESCGAHRTATGRAP